MAFKLDDLIVDRVQYGYAESTDQTKQLFVLTQLSDCSINISAESKDATDAQGTLIKRFWQGKTGEFSASNAMLNLNVLGYESGNEKQVADKEDETSKFEAPKIITAKAGSTVYLTTNGKAEGTIDYAGGTIEVAVLGGNGAMGKKFAQATAASADEFAYNEETGRLTLPTYDDDTKDNGNNTNFIIKYRRNIISGVSILNQADKFPQTIRLTLKALVVDPCEPDVLRAAYIVMPSFQISPEAEITLDTEGTLDFSGDLQVDYCSADKALYYIYVAEDDEE